MWIGVDLVRLGELDRLMEREWFRVFAYDESELAAASGFGPDRAREFLAGRFAAKEAVLKAIGTGLTGGVQPRQVTIARTAAGDPVVRLTAAAATRAAERGLADVRVSITHKADLVLAIALALPMDAIGASERCEGVEPALSPGSSVT